MSCERLLRLLGSYSNCKQDSGVSCSNCKHDRRVPMTNWTEPPTAPRPHASPADSLGGNPREPLTLRGATGAPPLRATAAAVAVAVATRARHGRERAGRFGDSLLCRASCLALCGLILQGDSAVPVTVLFAVSVYTHSPQRPFQSCIRWTSQLLETYLAIKLLSGKSSKNDPSNRRIRLRPVPPPARESAPESPPSRWSPRVPHRKPAPSPRRNHASPVPP